MPVTVNGLRCGVCEEPFCCAGGSRSCLFDFAVSQFHDVGNGRDELFGTVCYQDEVATARLEFLKVFAEHGPGPGIESVERFVKYQNGGVRGECPHNEHLSHLAGGEMAERSVKDVLNLKQLERLTQPFRGIRRIRSGQFFQQLSRREHVICAAGELTGTVQIDLRTEDLLLKLEGDQGNPFSLSEVDESCRGRKLSGYGACE